MSTHILGISAFYHDAAACLLRDGEIIAAAQEERFTRKKHDPEFPKNAIAYCLREAGITAGDLDYVGFYDKPFVKFERILLTYLAVSPVGLRAFLDGLPVWLKDKLYTRELIRSELDYDGEILFAEHHESHAASAFYPSPFPEAAVLTMDGVGEWATSSYGVGRGKDLQLLAELRFPHSLGLLYSAFTYYTGFKVNSAEYKVMGLAPYGEPRYVDGILRELIDLKDDGSFKLNMRYFNYLCGRTMTNAQFDSVFGGPPRQPESPLSQREMDLARSVQEVTEEIMLRMARTVHQETGSENLCLAGGVALNCVGNGRILREGPFKRLWIQPAAGDAGGALGVAKIIWHKVLGNERHADGTHDEMHGALLGPTFGEAEIEAALKTFGARYVRLGPDELVERAADLMSQEKVLGWFAGRMEFGPRALGARSIIGDPRSPRMQSVMNLKIKFRESFRPFAPSVLRERCAEYFDLDSDSPYMLLVAPLREQRRRQMTAEEEGLFGIDKLNVPRSDLPAITHVDYSARVQTVTEDANPLYYRLIKAFEARTGCPVIVNTSFNVRGEPIVCTPADAYRCFMRTEMDALVVAPFLLLKEDQPVLQEETDWRTQYELD